MFLRFVALRTSDITSDTGPTLPINIVHISSIRPAVPVSAVAPAESPDVENALTASNRHCTAPASVSSGIEK